MLRRTHERRAAWFGPSILLAALTLSSLGGFAHPLSSLGQLRLTPEEVKSAHSLLPSETGSSGASSVREIVIHGDPAKPGLYTILLKVGPNTRIAAHRHPDDRMATVLSGVWYFGYGPKFDTAKLKQLPAGSVYAEPAGANHFAMTRGPVIVEITGYGPSGVTYATNANIPSPHHSAEH
ncbi:hypothetical protein CCAX7_60760 [Capsulimonas corticalis]|uniref:Uncharacterized protein n=1 Tax=Capsulimonas corticalis TaxID=2219043 RepID=A0A402CW40_9BACT|nr:cupin domain-containing protein [Capsulimonas corticalis]BDI34025.1 hypothetical protein CCAX7_60760 [Capsulimonas corticalis]